MPDCNRKTGDVLANGAKADGVAWLPVLPSGVGAEAGDEQHWRTSGHDALRGFRATSTNSM